MVNEMNSTSDDHTEGSESASPALGTTESSRKARIQGPGTTLEFTPVREPEPAVDFDSQKRTDTSIFIAPVAMNSAQIAHSNWMVDSGAGMSGTSSTINLKDTMRCKIPITPAFGAVMNATATLEGLGIKAIHIEGMHHNLLSVHQVCTGGESGDEQVGIFTSEGCQFFPLSKSREALKIMLTCKNTFYGLVKGGVYVYAPTGSKK